MLGIHERAKARLTITVIASALGIVAASGFASPLTGNHLRKSGEAVTVTGLTLKESSIVGGSSTPVHLDIAFKGTPGTADVVRLRPEKNDATGWKTTDPAKGNLAFNNKDDTGPYVDVTLSGTSPQSITIETANPDATRKDTFLTGKLGTADGVDSGKITITHDTGG